MHLDRLRDGQSKAPMRAWIRVASASRELVRDGWRVLDLTNYFLFCIAFFFMIKVGSLVNDTYMKIASINRADPYGEGSFVDFYRLSYWTNGVQRYGYRPRYIPTYRYIIYMSAGSSPELTGDSYSTVRVRVR